MLHKRSGKHREDLGEGLSTAAIVALSPSRSIPVSARRARRLLNCQRQQLCSSSPFGWNRPPANGNENTGDFLRKMLHLRKPGALRPLKNEPKSLLTAKVSSRSLESRFFAGAAAMIGTRMPVGEEMLARRRLFALAGGVCVQRDNPAVGAEVERGERGRAAATQGIGRAIRIWNWRLLVKPRNHNQGIIMKKTLFALSGVTLLAWSLLANAADLAKIEFKGVPFGASQETLLSKFPDFKCSSGTCTLYVDIESVRKCAESRNDAKAPEDARRSLDCQREYRDKMKYGPAVVQIYIARFEGNKLGYVTVLFNAAWYRDVRDALIEKFGSQAEEKIETAQNRFGENIENHMATWKLGKDFVQIEERGAGIETAVVRVVAGSFVGVDQETLRRERAREAAKDL